VQKIWQSADPNFWISKKKYNLTSRDGENEERQKSISFSKRKWGTNLALNTFDRKEDEFHLLNGYRC
jgi:hypothetical protein